jgi:hypothetical protein
MTELEAIECAENYLQKEGVKFARPGYIGEKKGQDWEVIFLVPEALNPNMVIDPPDVRMWVNTISEEVTFIYQM